MVQIIRKLFMEFLNFEVERGKLKKLQFGTAASDISRRSVQMGGWSSFIEVYKLAWRANIKHGEFS